MTVSHTDTAICGINTSGALHNGVRYSEEDEGGCTRIQGYRRGLAAMRRGAPGAYFVGANHPMWASVGLLEASRLSSDVFRNFGVVRNAARESLLRSWQHGVLWHGDPDVALLAAGVGGELPLPEALFAASIVLAVGGLMLSGDILQSHSPQRLEILRRLARAPPHARAGGIAWEDDSLRAGVVLWDVGKDGGKRSDAGNVQRVLFLFNFDDVPSAIETSLIASCHCNLVDYWYGILENRDGWQDGNQEIDASAGQEMHAGGQLARLLPARSARVFVLHTIL